MVTLRDYQKNIASQAVAILRQHGMVYLAMEVRTGKTFVSLEVAAQYGAKSVLFLTKKKAIQSIVSDYTAGEYSFELLATNYEQLGKFDPRPFDLIVCDESHCSGQIRLSILVARQHQRGIHRYTTSLQFQETTRTEITATFMLGRATT